MASIYEAALRSLRHADETGADPELSPAEIGALLGRCAKADRLAARVAELEATVALYDERNAEEIRVAERVIHDRVAGLLQRVKWPRMGGEWWAEWTDADLLDGIDAVCHELDRRMTALRGDKETD